MAKASELRKKLNKCRVVLPDGYIDSYVKDANDFFTSADKDYQSVNYDNHKDVYDKRVSSDKNIKNRGGAIRKILNTYGDKMYDEKTKANILSAIDKYETTSNDVLKAYQEKKNFYSQFPSQQDFDTYKTSQKYTGKSYSELEQRLNELQKDKNINKHKGIETDYQDKEIKALNDYIKNNPSVYSTMSEDEIRAKIGKSIDISTLTNKEREYLNYIASYNNGDALYALEGENEYGVFEKRVLRPHVSDDDKLLKEHLYNSYNDYFKNKYGVDTTEFGLNEQASGIIPDNSNKTAFFDEYGLPVTWKYHLITNSLGKQVKKIESDTVLRKVYNDISQLIDEEQWLLHAEYSDDQFWMENDPEYLRLAKKYGVDVNKYNDTQDVLKVLADKNSSSLNSQKKAFKDAGYDWDEIKKYKELMADKEDYVQKKQNDEKWAEEHHVWATALGVLQAPLQVVDLIENTADAFSSIGKGEESVYSLTNPYDDKYVNRVAAYNAGSKSAVEDAVLSSTDSDTLAWLAGSAYSGITSTVQSALTAVTCSALFGPEAGPAIALGVMGSEAAASSYNAAALNGSSHGESMLTAVSAGFNEALFEKVSMDRFIKMKGSWNKETIRSILKSAAKNSKNALIQGVVESSEELGTDIFNNIADELINGDHSAYNTAVTRYINDGYTEKEAEKLATLDEIKQTVDSVIGGLFGGFSSGSVKVVADTTKGVNEIRQSKSITKEYIKESLGAVDNIKNIDSAVDVVYKATQGLELTETEQMIFDSVAGERIVKDVQSSSVEQLADTIELKKKLMKLTESKNDVAETSQDSNEQFDITQKTEDNVDIDTDVRYKTNDGKTYIANTSQAVDVGTITNVTNDDVMVEVSDGTERSVQNVKNLDLASSDQVVLYEGVVDIQKSLGKKISTGVANRIVNEYKPSMGKVTDYLADIKKAIRKGYILDKSNLSGKVISDDLMQTFFDMGQTMHRIDKRAHKSTGPATVKFDGINESTLTENEKAQVNVMKKVSKHLGVNVVFYESKRSDQTKSGWTSKYGEKNGQYDPNTNTVYLDLKAGFNGRGTILFTAAHELTHFIREYSSEYFKQFADFLIAEYVKKGIDVEDLISKKMQMLNLSFDRAYEEVIADSCESFLVDSNLVQQVEKLARQNKGLANKIKEFIADLLNKIKQIYKDLKPDSFEGKLVLSMEDALSQLHSMWVEGIKNASKDVNTSVSADTSLASEETTKNTATDDGVRFDVRKEFASELQTWFDRTTDEERKVSGKRFLVGNTTNVLKSIGVKDYSIYFGGAKINKILSDNTSMSLEVIKQAVGLLEEPILIMKSRTVDDSIVLFGEVYTEGKKPVMISVLLNPKTKNGEILDYAVITSAYGRRASNLQNLIDNSQIYYINENKKRTDKWLKALGLQLPSAITKYGSINIITNSNEKSNSKIKSSSRITQKMEREYLTAVQNGNMQTAQRMVDEVAKEKGYSIKAYHGTRKADFTVFRRNVNYFTSNSDVAQSYAPNDETYSVYLKMQNPFVLDAKNSKWSKIPISNDLVALFDTYGSSYFTEDGKIRTSVADIVAVIEDAVDEGDFDYDGVIIRNVDDTGSYYKSKSDIIADDYIVFNRNNIKSADPVTYDDNGDVIPLSERFNENNEDIRFSMRDSDGDILTPEQQEYFKDSKIRVKKIENWNTIAPDGALFKVYHGTNTGDFFEFDKKLIGSSNDSGWFGKGFYFAFTENEASYYGNRVLECYLNVTKPYFFDEELTQYDNNDTSSIYSGAAAFIINLSEKFPEIAKEQYVYINEFESDNTMKKSFIEFAEEIKEIYKSDRLKVKKCYDRNDEVYYYHELASDIKSIKANDEIKESIKKHGIDSTYWAEYLYKNGRISEQELADILDLFEEYGSDTFRSFDIRDRYKTAEEAEKNRLTAVMRYLSDGKYSYVETRSATYYMSHGVGGEFVDAIRKQGYDGIVQSRIGDEIVVFEPEQIKLTSNKAPTENPDIRYHSRVVDQIDSNDYNNIRVSKSVYNRLRREAMTWHADKTNRILNTVLDDKSYYYILTDTYELKVISIEKAENIHERKKVNDGNKRKREIPDEVINESPNRRRHSNNNRLSSEGGREYSEDDRYGDRQVRRQRKSDGRRGSENDDVYNRQGKTEEVKLYQARPTLDDFIFDDTDGEMTDTDAFLMSQYITGDVRTISHIVNNTKNIDISDAKINQVVSRLVKSYDLSDSYNKDIKVAVMSLLESKNEAEVKENMEMLNDIFEKSVKESTFASEYAFGKTDSGLASELTARLVADIVENKYNSTKNEFISNMIKVLHKRHNKKVREIRRATAERVREAEQKKYDKLVERHKEQRKRQTENRNMTAMRNKIRKLTEKFNTRLLNPVKGKYVPRHLISQTVELLNMVNLDTGRSHRLSEKIAALRNSYDALQNDAQHYAVYDKEVSTMMLTLSQKLGNTPIMNMSLYQLQMTYDTLNALDTVIRNSIKLLDTEYKHDTYTFAKELEKETSSLSKTQVGIVNKYLSTQFRPETFFDNLAGFKKNSHWSMLYKMLNEGQLKTTQLEMEFSMLFDKLIADTKSLKTLSNTKELVDIGLADDKGKKVEITRGMMLSVYMHLTNQDNAHHIARGGFTVPNIEKYYKGKFEDAFGIGQHSVRGASLQISKLNRQIKEANERLESATKSSDIAKIEEEIVEIKISLDNAIKHSEQYIFGLRSAIEKQLTPYEKEWLKTAHKFFDENSRDALNETTMKLLGFEKAKVNDYYPIHTDPNYRDASFENIVRDMSLENSGFMKSRNKGASNPILLEDITDVIDSQIKKVAKYCGMTIAIKNFQKVYGITNAGFETSVQKELSLKFSKDAAKYIDNLITDITTGRGDKSTVNKVINKVRGNLAGAVLSVNFRVAIAQAASYPTAASEIGWKPLLKALGSGGKNERVFSRADKELIAKWSPLLYKRMQGYSTTEIGDLKGERSTRVKAEKKMRWLMGWIQAVDGATVGRLWYAAEYYVQDTKPSLKKGTDAYYEEVAKVFNNVVERTQPNYTVMQRPDILRNPNALLKSLTMFMTQRLQNFNILYDSAGKFIKYRNDFRAGINDVTANDVKEAKIALNRAVVSQATAAITIVAMKCLADILTHSMDGYRDDDEELTAQSISTTLLDNFIDTIVGNLAFGSDVYSIGNKIFGDSKDYYYGVSINGVDSVVEFIKSLLNLADEVTLKSYNDLATAICQLCGFPLKNIEKIGLGFYRHFQDIANVEFFSFEAGVERTQTQNVNRYDTYFHKGDINKAKEIVNEMVQEKINDGKPQDDAKSLVRGAFTRRYKNEYLDACFVTKDKSVENDIITLLYRTGLYGDLTELYKTLDKWKKDYQKDLEEKDK